MPSIAPSDSRLELTPSGFAALMGAAADAIVIIDEHGRILNFNGAAERLFGYSSEQVLGENVAILIPSKHGLQHDTYLRNYLDTRIPRFIGIGRMVEAKRQDATVFPAELSVGEYSDGNSVFFVGIIRDLTERERQDNALRQSESRLREREQELNVTLDNAPIGILSIALDGRIIGANQAACRLMGYSEQELTGKVYFDLLLPQDVAATEMHRQSLTEGSAETFVLNNRYLHRDGSVVHVVLHCGVVFDVHGEAERFVAQLVDRTSQVRAEQEATEFRERLAHVDRISTMGEMASGIAHEINQPLAAISSYVQACRRRIEGDPPDIPRSLELLARADEQSLRAGKIVERVRALIRSQDRLRERTRLNEILSDAVQLARVDTNTRGIQINENVVDASPEVIVDSIQIQQVVLNLIRNAIDATEGVEPRPPAIELGCQVGPEDDMARVWVREFGGGVPQEMAEQLCEPFVTSKSLGTGMGLSISRTIVNAHGGQLWYENAGDGACFIFTLPLAVSGEQGD